MTVTEQRTVSGGTAPGRTVILHADDFGMNSAVNAGILRAFREGYLTSTSLLANAPAADAALIGWRELAAESESRELPTAAKRSLLGDTGRNFDLGLHLNLTQGRPLTQGFPAALRTRQGDFLPIGSLYRKLFRSGDRYRAALHAEIAAQLRWMLDRGVTPTHVNGHQYAELIPAVTGPLIDELQAHRIRCVRFPCESKLAATTLLRGEAKNWLLALIKRGHAIPYRRRLAGLGFAGVPRYCGTAHAGRVTLPLIETWIGSVPHDAALEIGLHPGEVPAATSSPGWDDPLAELRPQELALLTSDELAECLLNSRCHLGRLSGLRAASFFK